MYLALVSLDGVSVEGMDDGKTDNNVYIYFPSGHLTVNHKENIVINLIKQGVSRSFTNISATMTTLAIRRFIENPYLDSR